MDKSSKNLSELPASSDIDFWADGQRFSHRAVPIKLCDHKNRWMEHVGYIDNHDGTVTCKWCPWGTTMAGYLKCIEGRIVDLRSITR